MISSWILLLVSVAYIGLLFGIAWYGDHRQQSPGPAWFRPAVYSLALAVYCSSWTFYGAVGTAARTGLGFLPIYLGPILMLLFGWRILERLALISREQSIVSIADFLSSRYGRARKLAALVAVIAVIAAIPYVALQFKAVAMSIEVLTGATQVTGPRAMLQDPALYVALLLALFAILFGTRQVDATEHHHGMMLAVATESLVKLLAFLAVGIFAIINLPGSGALAERMVDAGRTLTTQPLSQGFVAQTLLAFTALICLPRQFHVAIVECQDVTDIRRARWMFGIYLVLICLMVLPITVAGQSMLAGLPISPDTYVLALPMHAGAGNLALAVYIGGFSAATGMVIVASVALATMVSNDLVMPLLWRSGMHDPEGSQTLGERVLWVRRATIVLIALFAYAYYRGASGGASLAAFGLLAFAAVAQFAPALIGGLYWHGASRQGAIAGMLAGFVLWIYTLLLPALSRAHLLPTDWLREGPMQLAWLRPESLFGLQGWDPLTHGVFWSLLVNIGMFLVVSARYRPNFDERIRASPFLDPYAHRPALVAGGWKGSVITGDLLALASRIVGERHAQRSFTEHLAAQGRELVPAAPADRVLVQFTERLLAASIGAATARLTLTTALRGSGMELGEVVAMLDEAGQELRFNRAILAATLENMSQGVSVVDRGMHLIAWNRRYQEMFEFPDGLLYVGRPVADLIRYNAGRGELGPGDVEVQIAKRVDAMRAGTPHVYERVRAGGQVTEMRGRPLPGGGYVTTYTDISDYKRVEQALRDANETLEQRVAERTQEAEAANQSRTRFLAAISHDVLQPMNAARLFASALHGSESATEQKYLAERVDTALRAAEELLDGLLDISHLDAGALKPELSVFGLDELLADVAGQFAPLAASRGLSLKLHHTRLAVRSDRRLLRRVLQNYLANALRYTQSGRVVLGVRRHGASVDIEVWDSGPGIPEHHLQQIFEEFQRFEQASPWGERGLGLGLSICQRISRMLDHPLHVRSWPGRGSVFSISLPLATAPAASEVARPVQRTEDLHGLRVLCLDNDREILDGMRALLQRWGIEVTTAETVDEAIVVARTSAPDVLLADYHLHDRMNGLDALDVLREACGADTPGALLTADGSHALKQSARDRGYPVLTKPLKPASLRAWLAAQRIARNRPAKNV